jgi:phospholipid transport system substrate-binding protein
MTMVAPAGAAEDGPAVVVERLHGGLLGVLKDSDQLPYEARFARLRPLLADTFDLDFMAEKAVGRAWNKLDADDRARWTKAFRNFTTANYAGRFTGFTGQSFETLGTDEGASETKVVRTRLLNPSGEDVALTYRLWRTDDGWRIIDVYLDGTVSELALRRTEYASVLKRDGFERLLVLLTEKTEKLAAEAAEG